MKTFVMRESRLSCLHWRMLGIWGRQPTSYYEYVYDRFKDRGAFGIKFNRSKSHIG